MPVHVTEVPQLDPRVLMTERQVKIGQEWFNEKIGTIKPCQVCGVTEYQVAPHLVSMPAFQNGVLYTKTGIPAMMMMCGNCGNMLLFNAMAMGLLSDDEEESNGH